jgi:hypothetical protein
MSKLTVAFIIACILFAVIASIFGVVNWHYDKPFPFGMDQNFYNWITILGLGLLSLVSFGGIIFFH